MTARFSLFHVVFFNRSFTTDNMLLLGYLLLILEYFIINHLRWVLLWIFDLWINEILVLIILIILILTLFFYTLMINLIVTKSMLDIILFSGIIFTASTIIAWTNRLIDIKLTTRRTSILWVNGRCTKVLNSWWLY